MYLEDMFGLHGKTAVVTGGGRGIGQAVALGLSKAGAKIAIFNRGNTEETVRMIRKSGGDAIGIKADVTKEEQVVKALEQTAEHFGSVDLVFNNAGTCIHQSSMDATVEEFRQVLDVNLTGIFIVARAAARIMIAKGIRGSIINMASMSGTIVNIPQWQCSYNASKAGVIHLTRSLAMEWAEHGIRVNSISPGYVATPMATDTPQDLKDAWMKMIPLHRMCKPEELMPVILCLASDASGYTTGSDYVVDGGYTCI